MYSLTYIHILIFNNLIYFRNIRIQIIIIFKLLFINYILYYIKCRTKETEKDQYEMG